MTTFFAAWAAGIFGFVAGAAWVGMMRGDPLPGEDELNEDRT